MGSTIYRWDDTGAPSLTGEYGSLISVLKAVLVNGYGDKDPLGWTLEFEDATQDKAVFRMKEGTRTYIQFDDRGYGGVSYKHICMVRAYKTMDGIDSGISPCPVLAETASVGIAKHYSSGSTLPRPWIIIGDGAGFWIIVKTRSTVPETDIVECCLYHQPHYIGDLVPWDESQKNRFVMLLSKTTNENNIPLTPTSLTAASPCFHAMNSINNEYVDEHLPLYLSITSGSELSTAGYFGLLSYIDGLSPKYGEHLYVNPGVYEPNSVIGEDGVTKFATYRGRLPGFKACLHHFPARTLVPSDIPEFYEYAGGADPIGFTFTFWTANFGYAYNSLQIGFLQIGENFRNVF